MIMVKLSINSKWEVVVLKGNNGYILLESLISLAVLIIIVSSYVEVTVKMQKDSQQRLSSISNYRDLIMRLDGVVCILFLRSNRR